MNERQQHRKCVECKWKKFSTPESHCYLFKEMMEDCECFEPDYIDMGEETYGGGD